MKPNLRQPSLPKRLKNKVSIRGMPFYWQNSTQCINDLSYPHAEQMAAKRLFLGYIRMHTTSASFLKDYHISAHSFLSVKFSIHHLIVSGFCSTPVTQVDICFLCLYQGEIEYMFCFV